MGKVITAADIANYLDLRDDFDLELFAYRELLEHGWVAHHGGAYTDPYTEKPRQYDIAARKEFSYKRDVYLAVECKGLSAENPLIVSRVPRADASHDLLKLWLRPQIGDAYFTVERYSGKGMALYPPGGMVGKSTTQIRWTDGDKRLAASDAETYDKWSQALTAAASLLDAAILHAPEPNPRLTFVMPVLVVSDNTLWAVDYAEDGKRAAPMPVEEVVLYVDRKRQMQNRNEKVTYRFLHLHIYTRKGFVEMLNNISSPTGLLLERIFGWALRVG
jgi:hypothetical protein